MLWLFSYCLRYDDGGAPNPFWRLCTHAICKPLIRRAARIGERDRRHWLYRISDRKYLQRDYVCHMCDQKITMQNYYRFTQVELPGKILYGKSADHRRQAETRFTTFLYPFLLYAQVRMAKGTKGRILMGAGSYSLITSSISGDRPVALPAALQCIMKHELGYKSISNASSV